MTDLKRVRRIHKVSTGFLYRVFYDHIEVKLRERRDSFKWPEVLGIDEHFFRRGKGFSEFVTVFTDIKKKRLFEVALGKNTKGLVEQINEIPGRENVKVVVIDMSKTYRALIKQMFPNAKVVAGKFHVLRLITPALIKTRKDIHGHRQDLQIRRQLLRNRMKLEYFERFDIDRYLKQHPELDELYRWKERLHEFYRTKGIKKATQAYNRMIDGMAKSASEPVLKLLRTFKTWRAEILEYFENRLTNAFTEQTNNRGKLVQKRGYGYKSFRNSRLRMLSACLYSGCALWETVKWGDPEKCLVLHHWTIDGAHRPMLREPLRIDIAYPIQWRESRVNLTELAKLRYIHGWSRQELARHYRRTLNAITNYCQSIRRKNFELDGLTSEEKERIKWAYRN